MFTDDRFSKSTSQKDLHGQVKRSDGLPLANSERNHLKDDSPKSAPKSDIIATNNSHRKDVFVQTSKALDERNQTKICAPLAIASHVEIQEKWAEIERRRNILYRVKEELKSIRDVRHVAKSISSARNNGQFSTISSLTRNFEALNNQNFVSMDQQYLCLRNLSENVSITVADSMHRLRFSLRRACLERNFDLFCECYHSFDELGARAQFPAYLFRTFKEELNLICHTSIDLKGSGSLKLLAYFQATAIVLEGVQWIHEMSSLDTNLNDHGIDLREVRKQFFLLIDGNSSNDLFWMFISKTAETLKRHELSLIVEPHSNLFRVLEAVDKFTQSLKAIFPSRFNHRSTYLTTSRKLSNNQQPVHSVESSGIFLRRGQSSLRVHHNLNSSERHSIRNMSSPLSAIADTVHQIAFGSLRAIHTRHIEELNVITITAECWVRIRLTEKSLQEILNTLFHKNITGILMYGSDNDEPTSKDWVYKFFGSNAFETSGWTLTTASISLIRWVSGYIGVGLRVPDTLPYTLSNVKDILLILVYISIDMKSRIDLPQQIAFLQKLEDALLERPNPKSIEDFIAIPLKQSFRCFLQQYQKCTREGGWNTQDRSNSNWSIFHSVTLPNYSSAAGLFFSQAIQSQDAIIRQCVAAEAIKTLCNILDPYSRYLEQIIDKKVENLPSLGPHRMASLRSAISLSRAIADGFYDLLGWDVVGGWEAISAVIETCRALHTTVGTENDAPATFSSSYVSEICTRIKSAYHGAQLPPAAAERLGVVMCASAMDIVVEGFARVRICGSTAAASQMLVDVNELASKLTNITGVTPCPGKERAELFVKAAFLPSHEIKDWVGKHRIRLKLTDAHMAALLVAADGDNSHVFEHLFDS